MIPVFNPYSFTAYSIGQIGAKTAQNSIHFVLITQKCSNTNGYSDFGFQTKILFCLILYVKVAIAPNDYPVVYSFTAADTGALCRCCVPCALCLRLCPCLCPCTARQCVCMCSLDVLADVDVSRASVCACVCAHAAPVHALCVCAACAR